MRILDLYCCQGGAAMGYYKAGFKVVGVDKNPQPRYPFEFFQGDALSFLRENWESFDAIHASPPCQHYSVLTPTENRARHPDMIDETRIEILKTGLPYVIENVSGARFKLRSPIMLCGTMFGLPLFRHRFFEVSGPGLFLTPGCKHDIIPVVVSGTTQRKTNGKRREFSASECANAMGIHWMTRTGLDQAIPPAYTEFLGKHLIEYILTKVECA